MRCAAPGGERAQAGGAPALAQPGLRREVCPPEPEAAFSRRGSAVPRGVPQVKESQTRSPDVPGPGSPPRPARPASALPAPPGTGPAGDPDPEAPRAERKGLLRGVGPQPIRSRGGTGPGPPATPGFKNGAIISAGGRGHLRRTCPSPDPFPTSRFPVPAALSLPTTNNGPRLGRGARTLGGASPGLVASITASPRRSPSSAGPGDIVFCF